MPKVNIYLIFNGNCEEAFDFYKSQFGGDFATVARYKDMPSEEGKDLSSEDGAKIMHVSLPISEETVLMGSDEGGEWTSKHIAGNNFSISITTDSKEESDKLFNGLSEGGTVKLPMNDTFWGDYFGMFTDKFGINWMVSTGSHKES